MLVVENRAGLRSMFHGESITIDWSPPIINNLQVDVHHQGNKCSVDATWQVTDAESVVQDCHWSVGESLQVGSIISVTWEVTGAENAVQNSHCSVGGSLVIVSVTCEVTSAESAVQNCHWSVGESVVIISVTREVAGAESAVQKLRLECR